jgi:hypothetical protein
MNCARIRSRPARLSTCAPRFSRGRHPLQLARRYQARLDPPPGCVRGSPQPRGGSFLPLAPRPPRGRTCSKPLLAVRSRTSAGAWRRRRSRARHAASHTGRRRRRSAYVSATTTSIAPQAERASALGVALHRTSRCQEAVHAHQSRAAASETKPGPQATSRSRDAVRTPATSRSGSTNRTVSVQYSS